MEGGATEDDRSFDPEAVEAARKLFVGPCEFVAGAAAIDGLPAPTLPEVAFAGRSNVGKSSLINALTGRRMLARTSQTPGRTQQINFFDLGGRLMLVDLPGYGYHQAGKGAAKRWSRLIELYLKGRQKLRRVLVLVDARRGLGPADSEVMDTLDEAAVSYQVVLTKADQIRADELDPLVAATAAEIARRPAAHPEVRATSAREGAGIESLRAVLAALALPPKTR